MKTKLALRLLASSLLAWLLNATPFSAAAATITTYAGGGTNGNLSSAIGFPATNAALTGPVGLAIGRDGTSYFHDLHDAVSAGNFRAVNPTNGIINTIVSNVSVNPVIAVDRGRHRLYFPDFDDDVVPQINLANNTVSAFAGVGSTYPCPLDGSGYRGDGGPASGAWFSLPPNAVTVDGAGNVFIAEGSRIRKVNIATGIIATLCGRKDACCGGLNDIAASSGDGGPATNATLNFPARMATDRAGNVFILDIQGSRSVGCRVRRIDAATGIINTIAGAGANGPVTAGPALGMGLTNLQAIAVNDAGTELFLGETSRIYRMDLVTGILSPFAGNGTNGFSGDGGPALNAEFNSDGVHALAVAPGGGSLNAQLLILNKAALVAGGGPLSFSCTNLNAATLHPATPLDTSGPANRLYLIQSPNRTNLVLWAVNDPLGARTVNSTTITLPDNGGGATNKAPQLGVTNVVDVRACPNRARAVTGWLTFLNK